MLLCIKIKSSNDGISAKVDLSKKTNASIHTTFTLIILLCSHLSCFCSFVPTYPQTRGVGSENLIGWELPVFSEDMKVAGSSECLEMLVFSLGWEKAVISKVLTSPILTASCPSSVSTTLALVPDDITALFKEIFTFVCKNTTEINTVTCYHSLKYI